MIAERGRFTAPEMKEAAKRTDAAWDRYYRLWLREGESPAVERLYRAYLAADAAEQRLYDEVRVREGEAR